MAHLLTIAQAKDFLRISSGAVDAQVTVLLDGAENWLAERAGTAFKVGSCVHELTPRKESLRPPVLPIVAVSRVTDLWSGEEIPEEEYRLGRGPSGLYERIVCGGRGSVPQWWDEGRGRYEVQYTAGYNDGDSEKPAGSFAAPSGLKSVLLDLVARAWDNRGGVQLSSAAGIYVNWDVLAGGEIMDKLRPLLLHATL